MRPPRTIEQHTAFRRDYRRESRGRYRNSLAAALQPVLEALALDEPLPAARRDHALSGEWADARECHVRPDLLLVYRKPDPDFLHLLRLGSHALLFGS